MKYRLLVCILACFVFANAQVPLSKEPRHHPVFENKSIRVLNVLLPPGDTTQYHLHNTPSLFLFFTSTTTGSQLQGGTPGTGRSAAGTLLFENLSPPHTRVHRVWNIDTNVFHVMDVELLSKDSGFTERPLQLPHTQLVIDTPWARAYKIILEKDAQVPLQSNTSLLLIAIDTTQIQLTKNGTATEQAVQPGTFFWIPAKALYILRNQQNTTARFALFEVH